jgi:hypothetical protein
LTVPQICAYRRYWEISPPTHILAAGFMGYKAKNKGSVEELAAMFGAELPDG